MEYKYNDIEKVLEFKTWSNKRKIDELQIKDTRQDQNNTESKKETKAD